MSETIVLLTEADRDAPGIGLREASARADFMSTGPEIFRISFLNPVKIFIYIFFFSIKIYY